MAIEVVNTLKAVRLDDVRTDVMLKRRLHSWLLCFAKPGQKDKMHAHNEDETFYCVQGECTMSFPDGTKSVMTPGMIALIPGGEFYQLENTGNEPMVLLGKIGRAHV